MYCPSCKSEFIDSITICSDCNITLVENIAFNEPLENINWVKVKEVPGKVFGEMMGEVLDSEGIPYFLKSDWSASAYNIAQLDYLVAMCNYMYRKTFVIRLIIY
ncbi:MAG: hypothetical protein CM1200mP10_32380 [Candidatus Neomarinimicrobiota bacterium]|nr:MAG: hypothetical protein CM1200mP10_32380 [Candidatus Neomarinimicrobiota bacterium]